MRVFRRLLTWRAEADALAREGHHMLAQQRGPEAEQLFYRALQHHLENDSLPSSVELMKQIVVVHLAQFGVEGDDERCREQLEKAMTVQRNLEALLEQQGDWAGLVDAISRRGRQLEAIGDTAGCHEAYATAVEVADAHPAEVGVSGVVARLFLAPLLQDEQAVELLREALKGARALAQAPKPMAGAMELLARCYLARGRHELTVGNRFAKADKALEVAAKVFGSMRPTFEAEWLDAASLRIHTLGMLEMHPAAAEVAEEILASQTEDSDALLLCAYALEGVQRVEEALELLEKVRAIKTREEAPPEDMREVDEAAMLFKVRAGQRSFEEDIKEKRRKD
jgi:tetratricopeptide (TPR) repeat protein